MLTWLKEKFKGMSKKPWAEFETSGMEADGRIKWNMRWNTAFIDQLHRNGFSGMTTEETVQNFFLMCQMLPDGATQNETVSPASMPNLSSEAETLNTIRR